MVYLSEAGAAGRSWILFLVILAVHVVLFLVAIGFFYLHIVRLNRPKWLPSLPWLVGIGGVLLLAGLLLPVGLLPPGDLLRLPGAITFDPIFLFFLLAFLNDGGDCVYFVNPQTVAVKPLDCVEVPVMNLAHGNHVVKYVLLSKGLWVSNVMD